MRQSKAGLVQGQLFGSRSAAERFRVDAVTGIVTRIVSLHDIDSLPVETEIGVWDRSLALDDVRAVADLSYLQRRTAPVQSGGVPVRVADLFSGCGAMSLGVSEACRAVGRKFVSTAAFDVNQRVLNIFSRNFSSCDQEAVDLAAVLNDDLGSLPTVGEKALMERVGNVDFVVAGPPCQGHSNLNNFTRRDDPKNALYFLVARFAQLFRPRWIIIENVMAVLNDKGGVVNRTRSALERLGYETADGVVDLTSIGVAQTRKRHVMVAQLRSSPDGPRELPYLEELVTPYATRPRAVGWAIGDLLNIKPTVVIDRPRSSDELTRSRIDYLFDNDVYILPKSHRPESHKGKHWDNYKAVYGRMYWDEPAPTITSGFSTMGQGRFVHPKRRRTLTAHEAARIQSIPDFFDFSPVGENRSAINEAIGNAVPPKLSYVLALELLR